MSLPFIRATTGWLRWGLLRYHVPVAIGIPKRGKGLAPNIGMRIVWVGHEQQSVWRRQPRGVCRRVFINHVSHELVGNFETIRIKKQSSEFPRNSN